MTATNTHISGNAPAAQDDDESVAVEWDGSVRARLLPPGISADSIARGRPLERQIDPSLLRKNTGHMRSRPRFHRVYVEGPSTTASLSSTPMGNDAGLSTGRTTVLEAMESSSSSSSFGSSSDAAILGVYIRKDRLLLSSSNGDGAARDTASADDAENDVIHFDMNREAKEPVSRALARMVLTVSKKMAGVAGGGGGGGGGDSRTKKGGKGKRSRSSDGQGGTDGEESPGVWYCRKDTGELVPLNIDGLTHRDLWMEARYRPMVITLPIPPTTFKSGERTNADTMHLRLLVEACAPMVTAVRTFEDFSSHIFTGVPTIVEVDTVDANHCRIDWYVDDDTLVCEDSKCFVPAREHVGRRLSVLVRPLSDVYRNGEGCEEAYRFERPVEEPPENILLRIRSGWLKESRAAMTDRSTKSPDARLGGRHHVRVMTYNILADQNAFNRDDGEPFYPYVSRDVLMRQRRLPLIVHEILTYDADVICLQEVDESVYDDLLRPIMHHYEYQGFFRCKDSQGSREGCAMFWSRKRFEDVPECHRKSYAVRDLIPDFKNNGADHDDDAITTGDSSSSDNDDDSPTMRKIMNLLEKRGDLKYVLKSYLGHVVQMVPLKFRSKTSLSPTRSSVGMDSGQDFWVTNTHLYFHPVASHVRLLQMYFICRQLNVELRMQSASTARAGTPQPFGVIMCGDFNSSLSSNSGKLVVERSVPENFGNLKRDLNAFHWDPSILNARPPPTLDDNFPEVRLPASFPGLRSVVRPTPAFTHYLDTFVGTLDHVLCNDRFDECTAEERAATTCPMPTIDDVTQEVAMPSENLPSDHVSLVCDLMFTSKNAGR